MMGPSKVKDGEGLTQVCSPLRLKIKNPRTPGLIRRMLRGSTFWDDQPQTCLRHLLQMSMSFPAISRVHLISFHFTPADDTLPSLLNALAPEEGMAVVFGWEDRIRQQRLEKGRADAIGVPVGIGPT